jgi:hypothetical protein
VVAPGEILDRYRNANTGQAFGYTLGVLAGLFNMADLMLGITIKPLASAIGFLFFSFFTILDYSIRRIWLTPAKTKKSF